MFSNQRYLTRGVYSEIPLELQLFMWECIDRLPENRDYSSIELTPEDFESGDARILGVAVEVKIKL